MKGPLNIQRCPQGHPIIIQAGGSPPGQELSARSADLVFSVVNGDPAAAKSAYDGLKQRVIKHGRAPEDLAILPGVMPIIGESESEAKEQLARLQSWLTPTNALTLVSQRIGHDISGYPLDGPVPEFPQTNRGQAFSKALLDMARREKMTLRDLYNITAAARGHWVVCGTARKIADIFEEWFASGMADGFVSASSRTFEMPKSSTLMIFRLSRWVATNKFAGLMSRWTMPAACASASTSHASSTKRTAVEMRIAPTRFR